MSYEMWPIQTLIWKDKYRFNAPAGVPRLQSDETIEGTWRRVAHALAQPEGHESRLWERRFYSILENFAYLPAGRIIAGAGTGRDVTLYNCTVSGTIPDSMDGIFSRLREAALSLQQGAGIGMDFSTLRPNGADVKGVAAKASGPVSFMDCWDAMCKTIMSAGARRGAMMATLRCDHPDIEAFIDAKRDPLRLRNFNVSVLVTNAFMEAVKADAPWPLQFSGQHYKTVDARKLWRKIMRAAYETAEPGVIFIDRINETNNLAYCETISATNPCLAFGTLVATPLGLRPVESIRKGDDICTIDGAKPVSKTEIIRSVPVFKVALSDGSELTASAGHIFHVARDKWFDSETRLDQLCIGDKIRLAPSTPPKVKKVAPPPLSEREFGFLIGVTFGCGCFTEKSKTLKIACNVNEPEWIEFLRDLFQRLAGDASVSKSTASCTTVASLTLMRLLDEAGIKRGYSHEKTLSLSLFNSNAEFLKGFIDGMISTDGNVHMSKTNPMIRVSSTNKENLMMLKRALCCFGILARVYTDRSKPEGSKVEIEGRDVYYRHANFVLIVLGDGLKKIHSEIGISRPSRSDRLKKLVREYSLTGCTWTASILSIESVGVADVCDLYEPDTDTWIAEGVVNRGCAEQPLPPNGACLLGSINLTQFIRAPFSPNVYFDQEKVIKTAKLAVRMMDNVIDVSNYPIEAQRQEAMAKRRIGLGITGLGDALAMCGLHYGSPEACRTAAFWMKTINDAAYEASIDLAAEKGKFPLFSEKMGRSYFRDRGERPTRNSHLTSIAPTGTISLLAGNISGGVEPIYAHDFIRNIKQPDGSMKPVEVEDYAVRLWREMHPGQNKELPPQFYARAHDLSPKQHVAMQAALQPFVDSAISKTVNCPDAMTFEEFEQLYMDAYEQGLKSCAAFRPNEVTGSILEAPAPKPEAEVENKRAPYRWTEREPVKVDISPGLKVEATKEIMEIIHEAAGVSLHAHHAITPRERVMPGRTHKLKWGAHAVYVTINDRPDGSPYEIFINSKNVEHYAWSVALTRMISAIWRRGGDTSFVTEELKCIADPRGGAWSNGTYIPSIQAAIGHVIEEHAAMAKPGGDIAGPEPDFEGIAQRHSGDPIIGVLGAGAMAHFCPQCGSANVWFPKPKCLTCRDCSFSNCD